MYRLCEQTLNGNIEKDKVTELFTKVLETTILLGKSDALSSGARLRPDKQAQKEILDLLAE